jgi:hypothetical protein
MTEFRLRQILLRSTDVPAALRTYTDLAGLTVAFRDHDRYAALEPALLTVAVANASETSHPITLAYRVDDVDAALEVLLDRRFSLLQAPRDTAHERRSLLLDPDGVPTSIYRPHLRGAGPGTPG